MNQIVTTNADHHIPWNKGKLIGQKPPLKLKEIWAIRIRLQLANRTRELAGYRQQAARLRFSKAARV